MRVDMLHRYRESKPSFVRVLEEAAGRLMLSPRQGRPCRLGVERGEALESAVRECHAPVNTGERRASGICHSGQSQYEHDSKRLAASKVRLIFMSSVSFLWMTVGNVCHGAQGERSVLSSVVQLLVWLCWSSTDFYLPESASIQSP